MPALECEQTNKAPTLPVGARLPINRCNLPASILGGLTFQKHPTTIAIDNIQDLHKDLFQRLDQLDGHIARAQQFVDYMDVHFCLHDPAAAGFQQGNKRHRHKADYLRMVRGWSFDADAREGAVLKGWAESRFGLLPRHHGCHISSPESDAYLHYQEMRSAGVYNTNALDAQLDLLYTYAQYELHCEQKTTRHITLYRGINQLEEHEVLEKTGKRTRTVILNNLNSFTDERDRADEFGDYVLEVRVPTPKIVFFNRLLPGMLKGESEFVVLGGLYQVQLCY